MVRQRALATLCLALGMTVLGACGQARPVEDGMATACDSCHGFPPALGAHVVHVNPAQQAFLGKQFGCKECHKNVQRVSDPDHIVRADGTPVPAPAEVRFDDPAALAAKVEPGVTPAGAPSFAATSGTCSNVYCHGATLKGQAGLTLNTAPRWDAPAGAQVVGCGSCHGIPPSDHPASILSATQCVQCHLGAIDAQGQPSPLLHIDGQVEVVASNTNACSACHGDRSASNVPPGDPRSAPPTDASGNASSPAVGAHQAHVAPGKFSAGIACAECHVVPATVLQAGHIDGQVTVVFGPISRANPTSPPYAPAPAPRYDFTARTCGTTYCHGSFSGGTPTNPGWDDPSGSVKCGDCHGLPPPATVHPATGQTDCSACHGAGYHVDFVNPANDTVNPTLHVNGRIDRQ